MVEYFGLCVFEQAGKVWDNEGGIEYLVVNWHKTLYNSLRLKTS